MQIKLLAFGIAKDILHERTMEWELSNGHTIGDLKAALVTRFREFEKLKSLRCAVNDTYVPDTYILSSDDEVILIPPVSGG